MLPIRNDPYVYRHAFVSAGAMALPMPEFLARHKIRFLATSMDPVTKRPLPMTDVSSTSQMATVTPTFNNLRTDHEDSWDQARLDLHNQYHAGTEHILIDTSEMAQVDYDDAEYCEQNRGTDPVLSAAGPLFLSANKRLPHCFARLPPGVPTRVRHTVPHAKADVLTGQWSLARRDEKVMNADNDIPVIPLDYLIMAAGITTGLDMMRNSNNTETSQFLDHEEVVLPLHRLPDVPVPKGVRSAQDLEKLMDMISPLRSKSEPEWYSVGVALKSAAKFFHVSETNALAMWHRFSALCPEKYDAAEAGAKWNSIRVSGPPGFVGLRKMARSDNREQYDEYFKSALVGDDNATAALPEDTRYSSADVGDYMGRTFLQHTFFSYVDTESKSSHVKCKIFTGSIWEPIHQTHVFNRFMTQMKDHYWEFLEVFPAFEEYRAEKVEQDEWRPFDDMHLFEEFHPMCACFPFMTYKNASTLWDKCFDAAKNAGFVSNLLSASNDINRFKKLDTNNYLIGFTNGVFDLDAHEFRQGRPDDYVSMTVGYPYVDPYNPVGLDDAAAERAEHVMDEVGCFFKSLFRDDEVYIYFMSVLAYALTGDNWIEQFIVQKGRGQNGKSLCNQLMGVTFGQYAANLDVRTLTKPAGDSGSASPAIARLKNKRYVHSSEPCATDRIQVSTVKEMTGGDRISARGLYENTDEFKPTYCLHLLCNNVPNMDSVDEGVQRRLRVIDFPFKFDLPEDGEEESYHRKGDASLKAKFSTVEYAQQAMHILLHFYKTYIRPGQPIPVPNQVLSEAADVIEESNPRVQLVSEGFIEIADHPDKCPPTDDVYSCSLKVLKEILIKSGLANQQTANKVANMTFPKEEFGRSQVSQITGKRTRNTRVGGVKVTPEGYDLVDRKEKRARSDGPSV